MKRTIMKKLSTVLMVVICIALMTSLVLTACEKEEGDTTFNVTYKYNNGAADVVNEVLKDACAVQPNSPTKDGFVFKFWAKSGETTAYDFTTPVTADLVLEAVWEEVEEPSDDPTDVPSDDPTDKPSDDPTDKPEEPATVRIRWDNGDCVTYVFDGATPRNVKVGETIKFKAVVSPYYVGEPTFMAGNKEIELGEDGYYSFVVEAAVTVTVDNVDLDTTPITGEGTEEDPFIIKTPSNLKTITESINAGEYDYYDAYIKLDADLDMKGEKIQPIGGEYTYFQGEFDGNGHTISNFVLDYRSGVVGFFGYIAEGGVVTNLNVNTDIVVETSSELNYIVGGIVGYTISGDIINCNYTGTIKIINSLDSDTYVIYVGGICGFVQGYSTDYTGTISYCTVNGDIIGAGDQPLYTVGGIAGATLGSSDSSSAYVYNSAYNGTISGKITMAGGIVGFMREKSSVANCYSTGSISANNTKEVASAGGISGATYNETAITYSYSTAKVDVKGVSTDYVRDNIAGINYESGYNTIDSRQGAIVGSYYAEDGKVTEGEVTYDLTKLADVVSLLGWYESEWKVVDDKIVPYEEGSYEMSIQVRFDFGTDVTMMGVDGEDLTQSYDDVTIESYYAPIYWIYDGSGMNNFTADNGEISYGYFFDSERTQRIPSAMLLTQDMTVYVGFADYSNIAGEYHAVIGEFEAQLVFDDNGKMTMLSDGIVADYVYVYNGKDLLIRDGYFAYLYYEEQDGYSFITDYYAEKDGDNLVIYDNLFFSKEENFEITAYIKNNAMGKWYASDDSVYTFFADGTGSISDGTEFTYACTERTVTINMGNDTIFASISEDYQTMQSGDFVISVTRFDEFCGTWESDYNRKFTVTFDGKGNATYKDSTYSYVIEDGVLSFENVTAQFDESGLLIFNENGTETVMGKEGSFIGFWEETALEYWMMLYGIGKDGYGYGYDSNGVDFTYFAEEIDGDMMVNMYYGTTLYGMFNIATGDDGSELIMLAVYTYESGALVDDYNMCYYDPYEGTWNASNGMALEFNGLGAYNINMEWSMGVWVAEGYVTVYDAEGNSESVRYYYDKATVSAKFTYKDVEYTATFNGDSITVNGVVYMLPDETCYYDYQTENMILTFNGKSNVGLGKATLTIDGIEKVYDYTLTEDGLNLVATLSKESLAVYTVTFTEDGQVIISGNGLEDVEFGLYHVLVGKEYVLSEDSIIKIDGILNIAGEGKGVLGTMDVEIYYIDPTYVAIYYGTEFLYYLGYLDENNAVIMDEMFQVITVVSVTDGLAGEYKAADGTTLTLDGNSLGAEYIYPTAIITVTEEFEGETEEVEYTYVYMQEEGVFYIYELDRSGEEDVLVKVYAMYLEETEGAVAYTSEEEITVYLVEVTD